MAEKLSYYTDVAKQLLSSDKERDLAFQAYLDMFHGYWKLPQGLDKLSWIHSFRNTDPHDAIMAGVRVLASTTPRIRKHPYMPDEENKKVANAHEKILKWQLHQANRRRSTSVWADVAQSALLFQCVAANVVDLEWQRKVLKSLNAKTTRVDRALEDGRFVINVYNPMSVHAMTSSYGTEAVLLASIRTAKDVVAEWNTAAKELDKKEFYTEKVKYYDFMDNDSRCVWVEPMGSNSFDIHEQLVILEPDDHDLDFFPWVALMGGNQIEDEGKYKYHPMLFPLYFTGSWETQNIVATLQVSEVIAHASAPRMSNEGPSPAPLDIDYGDPNRIVQPPPGNVAKPLGPPPIDTALGEIRDRIGADIARSTVSRLLMGGDVPSGVNYSTLNLRTQTAVGALKPAKELAEKSLAEILKIMFQWVRYTKEPLVAYDHSDDSMTYGENYMIEPNEIDPKALFIDVELSPDVPTDRLQRANAGSIMNQYGYPREAILEDLGIEDPPSAMNQWYLERWVEHKFNLRTEAEKMQQQQELQLQAQQATIQMQSQAQQEQMMMQQQMQMQQQQQQQQGMPQQGMPQGMGGMPPEMMGQGGAPPGLQGQGAPSDMMSLLSNLGGQGFNPAMGGQPAAGALPPDMYMREQVRGQTYTGEEPMEGG
jgi:hypothetical protein